MEWEYTENSKNADTLCEKDLIMTHGGVGNENRYKQGAVTGIFLA